MEYILLEKNVIFIVFLAAKNKRILSCIVFSSQKESEDDVFLKENMSHFVLEYTEIPGCTKGG